MTVRRLTELDCESEPPTDPLDLPHTLTFFLSARDRCAVLGALKRIDADRSTALRAALGLTHPHGESTRKAASP